MNPDLESIVAADEEARARLTSLEKRLQTDIATALAERNRTREQRLAAAREASDHDVAAIEAAGEQELQRLQESQASRLGLLREAGERELERATRRYAGIIRHGPPEERG